MSRMPTIKPGELVILEHGTGDDEARTSVIVEAVQDDAILVGRLDDRTLPELSEGEGLRIIVLDRHEMFSVECTVIRAGDVNVRLVQSADAERVIRRQYVRITVDVPVSCMVLDSATNQWSPFGAKVTDISAGGMAMAADAIAPTGATIVTSTAIPEESPVVAVARVLPNDEEVRKVVNLATRMPLLRVEYMAIREADRERLIRFIFSEMLKQRRSEVERASDTSN